MKPHDREFQGLITQLVRILEEELQQNQRLLRLVRRKKDAVLGETDAELDTLLRVEREMLTNAVTMERERVALVTELGQLLAHPNPSRLRIAEIILHAEPENRDELLDLRDELRDVADELEDLIAVDAAFSRHRKEQMRLFVTPSRSKAVLDASGPGSTRERQSRGTATLPGRDSN